MTGTGPDVFLAHLDVDGLDPVGEIGESVIAWVLLMGAECTCCDIWQPKQRFVVGVLKGDRGATV